MGSELNKIIFYVFSLYFYICSQVYTLFIFLVLLSIIVSYFAFL